MQAECWSLIAIFRLLYMCLLYEAMQDESAELCFTFRSARTAYARALWEILHVGMVSGKIYHEAKPCVIISLSTTPLCNFSHSALPAVL